MFITNSDWPVSFMRFAKSWWISLAHAQYETTSPTHFCSESHVKKLFKCRVRVAEAVWISGLGRDEECSAAGSCMTQPGRLCERVGSVPGWRWGSLPCGKGFSLWLAMWGGCLESRLPRAVSWAVAGYVIVLLCDLQVEQYVQHPWQWWRTVHAANWVRMTC